MSKGPMTVQPTAIRDLVEDAHRLLTSGRDRRRKILAFNPTEAGLVRDHAAELGLLARLEPQSELGGQTVVLTLDRRTR